MALTREERKAIEQSIKRIRDLEIAVEQQGKVIKSLLLMVDNLSSETNMADWSSAQWDDFLRPYILSYSKKAGNLPQHNHTSNSQGGGCFAKLGANLVNGEE